ncbi:hypothetical protein NPIL_363241 [Nephila pilipes]|uniref:Uncharacterized protein n=1 Tax=Nephila pilipes TaxID=299642 RepID=A0A8X6UBW9_NEPPI|nr:hypothetical protein NPIL_363241 [Nephila pilipes]
MKENLLGKNPQSEEAPTSLGPLLAQFPSKDSKFGIKEFEALRRTSPEPLGEDDLRLFLGRRNIPEFQANVGRSSLGWHTENLCLSSACTRCHQAQERSFLWT